MSEQKTEQKKSVFSSWGALAAGIALAAVVYFWAKPAHQGVEGAKTAVAAAGAAGTAAAGAAASAASAATAAAAGYGATATASVATKPDAQIFFDSGKSVLPATGSKLLEPVIAKMKANPAAKAVISGYNDATGDKDKNALLSKERAKSVREALRTAGVAGADDARIVMQKPEETMGGVDADAARRVEVTVQ
jgi:outer membrane protein OmpA-like peptidoglycan-associated protein